LKKRRRWGKKRRHELVLLWKGEKALSSGLGDGLWFGVGGILKKGRT